MFSNQGCRKFEWKMQGTTFEFDIRLLKLGGCDMVLGVDWLREHSPLVFAFNQLQLSSVKKGKNIVLKGVQEEASLKLNCLGIGCRNYSGRRCLVSLHKWHNASS